MNNSSDLDLEDLYREVIIEHGRKPRNFREVHDANLQMEAVNPLCGDHLEISLRVADGRIEDIGFTGSGCAISQASASLMTEALKNTGVTEALAMFERVHAMLVGDRDTAGDPTELGKLAALQGVSEFPTRVKCATLAWQAVRSLLVADAEKVKSAITTE